MRAVSKVPMSFGNFHPLKPHSKIHYRPGTTKKGKIANGIGHGRFDIEYLLTMSIPDQNQASWLSTQ